MKRRACREEEKATRNADGQERRRLPPPGGETPTPRPAAPVEGNGRAPCGVPDCTLRKVLEYLPQSTPTVSARRCGASRTENTAQGADGIGAELPPRPASRQKRKPHRAMQRFAWRGAVCDNATRVSLYAGGRQPQPNHPPPLRRGRPAERYGRMASGPAQKERRCRTLLSERSTMWSPSNSNTSNVVSSDEMPNTSNCSCPGRSDWSPLILKS